MVKYRKSKNNPKYFMVIPKVDEKRYTHYKKIKEEEDGD